ncbi:MAG: hypothetical protein IK086_07135, partial [Clostridia bacterium]|nr:hypothetical protein [Clostridia bacterium]
DKIGAQYTIVLGDDELNSGKVNIKNMKTGETEACDISNIADCVDDLIHREALRALENSVLSGESI